MAFGAHAGLSTMPERSADRRRAELTALGNAVRRRRIDLKLSLDQLASDAGVSRRMLVGIEGGRRNPGVASIFELATALKVEAADLIAEAAAHHEKLDPPDSANVSSPTATAIGRCCRPEKLNDCCTRHLHRERHG